MRADADGIRARSAARREDIERPKARGCDTLTGRAINETKGYGNIKARRLHEGLLWKCQQVNESHPGEPGSFPLDCSNRLGWGGVQPAQIWRLTLWFSGRGGGGAAGGSHVPLEEYKRKAIAEVIAPLLM